MHRALLLVLCFFLNGCAYKDIHHGAHIDPSEIKIGQKIQDVRKTIGQESVEQNNTLYYMCSKAKQAYFLRPRQFEFKTIKVTHKNGIVVNVEEIKHKSKHNPKLDKILIHKDKISPKEIFREIISSSKYNPGAK
jgi:hypothetical protein